MAQLLSQASAYNPGHDLWILPESHRSRWVLRLDWYLNFQMTKASRHQSLGLSHALLDLLNRTELPIPEVEMNSESPLLVSTDGLLPTRWLAQVGPSENLEAWSRKIQQLWLGLGRPSFRLFLPTGLSAGAFSEVWSRVETHEEYGVVLDQDPSPL